MAALVLLVLVLSGPDPDTATRRDSTCAIPPVFVTCGWLARDSSTRVMLLHSSYQLTLQSQGGSWVTSCTNLQKHLASVSIFRMSSHTKTIFFNFNVDQGKSRIFTLWEAHSSVHSQQYEAKIKHFVITNILYTLRGRHSGTSALLRSLVSILPTKTKQHFMCHGGRKNKINFVELEIRLAPWQSSHLSITLHWL